MKIVIFNGASGLSACSGEGEKFFTFNILVIFNFYLGGKFRDAFRYCEYAVLQDEVLIQSLFVRAERNVWAKEDVIFIGRI